MTQPDATAVLVCDFDGTLAPIVRDRMRAFIEPSAREALAEAAACRGLAVWILTSRPVREVEMLGRLPSEDLPVNIAGLCGAERLYSTGRRIAAQVPDEFDSVARDVYEVLGQFGIPKLHLEAKTVALTVHTRRLAIDAESMRSLEGRLLGVASRYGWGLDHGKAVLELRPRRFTKGQALRDILDEFGPCIAAYAGDDTVDASAFRALRDWVDNQGGRRSIGVLVQDEETRSGIGPVDSTVRGPDGLAAWIRRFIHDAIPTP